MDKDLRSSRRERRKGRRRKSLCGFDLHGVQGRRWGWRCWGQLGPSPSPSLCSTCAGICMSFSSRRRRKRRRRREGVMEK